MKFIFIYYHIIILFTPALVIMSILIGHKLLKTEVEECMLQNDKFRKIFITCVNVNIVNSNIIPINNLSQFLDLVSINISYHTLYKTLKEYSNKSPKFRYMMQMQGYIYNIIRGKDLMYMGMNIYISDYDKVFVGKHFCINSPNVEIIDFKLIDSKAQDMIKYNDKYKKYLSRFVIDNISDIVMAYAMNDISIIMIRSESIEPIEKHKHISYND
jgi:hypothetical protein